MQTKRQLAEHKKAAKEVAAMMYASLEQFTLQEQNRRHKAILAIRIEPNRTV
jgi:hypothetical protein